MCEYAFPAADRKRLPELLGVVAGSLAPLDESPIQRRVSTYQRFVLDENGARVLIVVGTRWMLPENITILVTDDRRRFFRLSKWRPDKRLRLLLCDRLKSRGGLYLDHGRG